MEFPCGGDMCSPDISSIDMVDTTGEWHVMRTEFLKWGNSLALRVPGAFAKELGEGKEPR
jgi:hypothetical protein